MSVRITRLENAQTLYFSTKVGADYGAPQGGWTQDAALATAFESVTLAQEFIDIRIPHEYRPTCRIEDT